MIHKKAVALLSGGLDSMLAIAILKEQGVEIEAVNFQTMFGCCKDDAGQAARQLGVGFTLLKVADDYLRMVESPKYGYGRGMNPCVDCRIYMFRLARRLMDQTGAGFLISGEVLGQRPMSQQRRHFEMIEKDTGLEGRILRPLSALKLPETLPEKEGTIDRSKLFGAEGRSRRLMLELAAKYGIENPPGPSSGCALTDPGFGRKVKDIFEHRGDRRRWEFEILRMGRHFRLTPDTKVVVARNRNENAYFECLHPERTALISCENFGGPHALFIGPEDEEQYRRAARLVLRYSQKPLPEICELNVDTGSGVRVLKAESPASDLLVENMRVN